MTNEEIDALKPSRETDKIVAELVMGQTNFDHLPFQYQEGVTEDGSDGWDGFYCPRCGETSGECVKHYSTRIDDAWKVVEKMDDCGMRLIVGIDFCDTYSGLNQIDSSEGNAPLAICRAALKAVNHD